MVSPSPRSPRCCSAVSAPPSRCWRGDGRASGRDWRRAAMPEHGDGLARLLHDVDGPVLPRPEFAEALLHRLLGELTGPPRDIASSPPLSPPRPAMPQPSLRQRNEGGDSKPTRHERRFPTALAVAALA